MSIHMDELEARVAAEQLQAEAVAFACDVLADLAIAITLTPDLPRRAAEAMDLLAAADRARRAYIRRVTG